MTDWPNSNSGIKILQKPSKERGPLAGQELTPEQRRLMEISSMEWTEVKEREDLDSYPFVQEGPVSSEEIRQTVPIREYQPQAISSIGSLLPNWKDITYHPVEEPVGDERVTPAEAKQSTIAVENLGSVLKTGSGLTLEGLKAGFTNLFKQAEELPIFEAGMDLVRNLMGTQERQETPKTQSEREAEQKMAEYRWSREEQEHILQETQAVERHQQTADVARVEGEKAQGLTDQQKNREEGISVSIKREANLYRATNLRAALIKRHKERLNKEKEVSIAETTQKPIVNLNNQEGGNAGGQLNITSTGGGGVG